MQIDLEHVHYWMQAIRQSPDPIRTMDAFWIGQLKSKEWLIESLTQFCPMKDTPVSIDIHGGWAGVLASMLFQSYIAVKHIRSVDIDTTCESVATMMNKKEEIEGRFNAITADMCNTRSDADIIINTSCEHITQEQYDVWLRGMPHRSLLVLQSNNYQIPEHIRTANDLNHFKQQCNLTHVLFVGEIELLLYKRFMVIGRV